MNPVSPTLMQRLQNPTPALRNSLVVIAAIAAISTIFAAVAVYMNVQNIGFMKGIGQTKAIIWLASHGVITAFALGMLFAPKCKKQSVELQKKKGVIETLQNPSTKLRILLIVCAVLGAISTAFAATALHMNLHGYGFMQNIGQIKTIIWLSSHALATVLLTGALLAPLSKKSRF